MKSIRIGTRGSKLALWQAGWVESELKRHWPALEVQIVVLKTEGDRRLDVNLSIVGGKALFIKEIEDSLLNKKIDVAVHSLKDLPVDLPPGLIVAAVPERADPADVLLSPQKVSFKKLPAGTKVGTSSIRRRCQLKRLRSDLVYEDIRGNVDTRIRKMIDGKVGALVLAKAALDRLSLSSLITDTLPILPAVGQGALALEVLRDDESTLNFLKPLNDPTSFLCASAERAFLKVMGGNCQVPLACYAHPVNAVGPDEQKIELTAFVSDLEGKNHLQEIQQVSIADTLKTAEKMAHSLLKKGGKQILDEILKVHF